MIHDRTNPLGLPVASELILDDRQCPRCSYNLKGLKSGDRCPECGTPIRGRRRGFSGDSYNEVPLSYLRVVANGTTALMCGLPVVLGGLVWSAQQGSAGSFMHAAMATAVVGGGVWAFGVWLVHMERPGAKAPIPQGAPAGTEAKAEFWRLRIFNRFTQALWMLGPLLLWMGWSLIGRAAAVGGPTGGSLSPAAVIFVYMASGALVLAFIGFVTTCYYMSDLADWAYDNVNAQRLRIGPIVALVGGVPFGLMAAMLAIKLINQGVGPITLASFGVMFAVFALCMTPISLGMLGFSNLMRWALVNRDEALASDRRRSSKIIKRIEDGQKVKGRRAAQGHHQE